MAVRRSGSSACCGFIFCSNGSTCRTRRLRRRSRLQAMRRFVGIDLGCEPVPDETTVCRFRHLLEAHDLGRRLFDEVQRHLAKNGLKVATGTIVDATIINAPSSTKNAAKARDPEMHQTKKGNQWYFGMKAHVGVDSRTKLIHAAVATPANVADSRVLPQLLHGNETRVWGDQAYRGQRAVIWQTPPTPRTSPTAAIASAAWWTWSSGEEPYQVEGKSPGRALDRGRQTGLRLCQGALSRAQEERPSPAGDLRARQSVHCAAPSAALPSSEGACTPRKTNTDRRFSPQTPPRSHFPFSTPAAFISMHHPPRQPLIQTFPNRWYSQNPRAKGLSGGTGSAGVLFVLPLTPNLLCLVYDGGVYSVPNARGWVTASKISDIDAFNEHQFLGCLANIYFADWAMLAAVDGLLERVISLRPTVRHETVVAVLEHEDEWGEKYRVVRREELIRKGKAIIHVRTIRPKPSRWPSIIRWRSNPKIYSNGSGTGFLRRSTALENSYMGPPYKLVT